MLHTVALYAHVYVVKFNSSGTVANYMQQLQLQTSTCYSYVRYSLFLTLKRPACVFIRTPQELCSNRHVHSCTRQIDDVSARAYGVFVKSDTLGGYLLQHGTSCAVLT